MEQNSGIFNDLIGKENVLIALTDYGLNNVPVEIAKLKGARFLTISMDTLSGWKIYPPLSGIDQSIDRPPFHYLPNEIIELINLERLTIHGLNIKTLPDNFDKLENLKYLDLSMNKLTVSDELSKLKRLKKLKHVRLYGNRVDIEDIQNWRKENPDLEIIYEFE